jgi:hypothetical protein
MTPRVIASRTSATDLPEKSSRSAAAAAAAPACCPVPAALPARRRAGVERVLRAELARRVVPPEPELRREVDPDARELDDFDFAVEDERDEPELREPDPDEREPVERDDDDRVDDDREPAPDEREPDGFDAFEDDERDPDDVLFALDPLERRPREDPPPLPPDDSAMVALLSCQRELLGSSRRTISCQPRPRRMGDRTVVAPAHRRGAPRARNRAARAVARRPRGRA